MYRALIVDDEPLVLEQLHLLIDRSEWNVEIVSECGYGAQALQDIPRSYPDILITDISMPDMDGLTLIAKCRENGYNVGAFLVLTAYKSFEYAQTAMAEGVVSYLLKPVDRTELGKALEEAISCVERTRREECLRNYAPPSGHAPISMIDRFYGERMRTENISFALTPEQLELLSALIQKTDEMEEQAAEAAAERFLDCCRDAALAPSVVWISIAGTFLQAIQKNGWTDCVDAQPLETMRRQNLTLQELRAFLRTFLADTVHALRSVRCSQRNVTLQIKAYVDAHYTERIGLQELSERFYLNPVYLGQCFYKSFGEYLHLYISRKRVEKAQEFIRLGCSVQKASELVGYDNYSTFKSNFIRVTGMLPAQYKKICLDGAASREDDSSP